MWNLQGTRSNRETLAGSLSRTETGGIMDGKIEKLKEEKRSLKTKYNKASERINSVITDENTKQGKCHGNATGH